MRHLNEHVTVDPKVMVGKPVFVGTRIPVDLVLTRLAYGQSFGDLIEGYPALTKEKIQAGLLYAAEVMRREARGTLDQTADDEGASDAGRAPHAASAEAA